LTNTLRRGKATRPGASVHGEYRYAGPLCRIAAMQSAWPPTTGCSSSASPLYREIDEIFAPFPVSDEPNPRDYQVGSAAPWYVLAALCGRLRCGRARMHAGTQTRTRAPLPVHAITHTRTRTHTRKQYGMRESRQHMCHVNTRRTVPNGIAQRYVRLGCGRRAFPQLAKIRSWSLYHFPEAGVSAATRDPPALTGASGVIRFVHRACRPR
jgi:hypothetical protein